MQRYEYKVIPAPARGLKARGVKTAEARFALALETEMNALAEEGWEYLRADTLPSEERQGLTGSATHYRNVLVFRRAISPAAQDMPIVAPAEQAPEARHDAAQDAEPVEPQDPHPDPQVSEDPVEQDADQGEPEERRPD